MSHLLDSKICNKNVIFDHIKLQAFLFFYNSLDFVYVLDLFSLPTMTTKMPHSLASCLLNEAKIPIIHQLYRMGGYQYPHSFG